VTGVSEIEPARRALFARFEALGIDAVALPYPAHDTVEEGKALRGEMAGTFTKNLLLKDKKGRLFLVAVHEDRRVDLETLRHKIGASGRLGFVRPERMIATLGVAPGALTPLARLNESAGEVHVVIDAGLMADEQLNFHPLVGTESVGLGPGDLVRFLQSCGCEPMVVDLEATASGSRDAPAGHDRAKEGGP